ncbi:hypothetical protein BGZ97_005709 [Linnemannia gamsii]|uniref:CCHC-type domain-containing protein n=1 Tax=Linnemannia gamsii TaxID=64522 RepID=A0A9P6QQ59_9FUNG|nr:hypothetical protein BGZ97_005709 [Linnemannia gamsii]
MDPLLHPPPSPPTSTHEVDGEQTPPPSAPHLNSENSGTSISTSADITKSEVTPPLIAKASFADIASKGLLKTKANIHSAWSSVRAQTESRECVYNDQPQAVWFTNHSKGYIAAIPYQTKFHLINDVVAAVVKAFPKAKRISISTPGVVLIAFHSVGELGVAVTMTIECAPLPIKVLPTVFSSGSRIKIRAEGCPLAYDDCKTLAQKVFGSYGKVLLANQHFVAGTTVPLSSFDFTLEIPFGVAQDFMIPRVATIDNANILFSWSGSKFCYRCGSGSHTKLQCPKPLDFSLSSSAPLEEPLLARAFPDPDAPLRKIVKKSAPPKLAPEAPKQVAPSGSEWTEVKRGKNKKRSRNAFSGGGVTSASDSDSPKPPPRKQAPHYQGSNLASFPKLMDAPKAKKDINSTASSATPTTSAKSEEAPPVQKVAKADEATQMSSLGDTPEQGTDLQQQETEQQPGQQPEQQPVQQETERQPEQQPEQQETKRQPEQQPEHHHPLASGQGLLSSSPSPMEEEAIWVDDPEEAAEDSHMTSGLEDKQAKRRKNQELMSQLTDKAPTALVPRAMKSRKKLSTKTG